MISKMSNYNPNRVPVTVEFVWKRMDADVDMWRYNKEADEMGLECWTPLTLTQDVGGLDYYIGWGNDYQYHEKRVGPLFEVYVQVKDLPEPTLEEAKKLIEELMSDLKYQLAPKHGPEKAYRYPSVAAAREFLERMKRKG